MEQINSAFKQSLRRIAMIIGFTFFAFFVYKAGHEVSNPKIAAGAQRIQVVSSDTKAVDGMRANPAGYTVPAPVINAPVVPRSITDVAVVAHAVPEQSLGGNNTNPDKKTKPSDNVKAVKHKSVSQSD